MCIFNIIFNIYYYILQYSWMSIVIFRLIHYTIYIILLSYHNIPSYNFGNILLHPTVQLDVYNPGNILLHPTVHLDVYCNKKGYSIYFLITPSYSTVGCLSLPLINQLSYKILNKTNNIK